MKTPKQAANAEMANEAVGQLRELNVGLIAWLTSQGVTLNAASANMIAQTMLLAFFEGTVRGAARTRRMS